MDIKIPNLSLVLLIGASGSGKSTFAARHFRPTEILSSDHCRGLVCDDENEQSVTQQAFEILNFIAAKRLQYGRLVVVDATNVQPEARKSLLALAKEYHVMAVALVLNMPESLCRERNQTRPDRQFGTHVIRNQVRQLRSSLRHLKREGFRQIVVLDTPEMLDDISIIRQPLWTDKRSEHGPFDIIGDIHGCFQELCELLTQLGYVIASSEEDGQPRYAVAAPNDRRAIFLGDLVDRGPQSHQVLRLVMDMVESGIALCIPGNHESKLLRKLRGKNVKISHGLAETLAQLEQEPSEFHERVRRFIDKLISHYVLDDGKLVVAHAGMKTHYQGRASGTVRAFALYGETTGETDEFGLPVRYNWAADYRGRAMVVYGHTPVAEAEWLNNTICIDTGCVFGGKLSALRYPERELVSVAAQQVYYEPVKPLEPVFSQDLSAQQSDDDMLDMEDVLGKRIISTQWARTVTIREENALAALEVISRFAVHPRWLNYLPPTMSPCETSTQPGFLEYPSDAFAYYRNQGVTQVICEEKHMGSRAVVQICRDTEAARQRFGIETGEIGIVYTRSGRRFFKDQMLETCFLERLCQALTQAGLWQSLNSNWLTLDCELMPWSMKAEELVRDQYAAVGAAGSATLEVVLDSLQSAERRGVEVSNLLEQHKRRQQHMQRYIQAYRRYCWPVAGIDDLRLAPFHLLASAAQIHTDKDHRWHMDTLAKLTLSGDPLFIATPYRVVDLQDQADQDQACAWWQERVDQGGEGMVVKPLSFLAKGKRGWVQPALKCRGPEYLRIIYGPEYPDSLELLRKRGLSTKRSLAMREFFLGLEALHRFVGQQPLRRVHECVLGVLALESEPVDPRL